MLALGEGGEWALFYGWNNFPDPSIQVNSCIQIGRLGGFDHCHGGRRNPHRPRRVLDYP